MKISLEIIYATFTCFLLILAFIVMKGSESNASKKH